MREFHIHHHFHFDPLPIRLEDASMAGRLERIEAKLDTLGQKADQQMSVYTDLLDQVAGITQLKPAIMAFIDGQNAKIDDLKATIEAMAQTSPDADTLGKLAAAVDELKGDSADIAAKIMVGTSADPAGGTEQPSA